MSTWFKVANNMVEHPSVIGLSHTAFRSFMQALSYASRNETDGWIPEAAGRQVMVRAKDAAELVEAGRIVERTGGWLIVNYLDHQRSKAQIETERASNRQRKSRQRSGGTPDNVTPMSRRDSRRGHAGVTPPDTETDTDRSSDSGTDSFGGAVVHRGGS